MTGLQLALASGTLLGLAASPCSCGAWPHLTPT